MRLYVRSLLLVLALYGLVFALGDVYLSRHGAPVWWALAFTLAFAGLQFWYAPRLIEALMKIRWDENCRELPARNREFIARLCADRGLKMPRLGVVTSASPNAFTYGHWPGNARVVVTTGLLSTLSTEEINAVLAHEMGHVEHYDFIVMTMAALAPLLIYEVYRAASRNDKTKDVGQGAYACYLLSRLLVLSLSRTREYFADQHAARYTGRPEVLVKALLKIGYGTVEAAEPCGAGAMALMGIVNLRSSREMRWDLVNPWARLYELGSTHPLTALRIHALQPIESPLPQKIQCGAFPLEVLMWAAPWMGVAAIITVRGLEDWLWVAKGILVPHTLAPALLVYIGVAWMLRTWFRFYGTFQPATIGLSEN